MTRWLFPLLVACGGPKGGDSAAQGPRTPSASAGSTTTAAGSPFTSSWTTTTSTTTPPGAPNGAGTGGTWGGIPTSTDTANWDVCDWALHVPGWLDSLNATTGRTLFCHSSSGVNYTFVDADVISCATHLDHAMDIFPSWGC